MGQYGQSGFGVSRKRLGEALGGDRWGPRLGQSLQNVEEMEGRENQEGEWVRPAGSDEQDS